MNQHKQALKRKKEKKKKVKSSDRYLLLLDWNLSPFLNFDRIFYRCINEELRNKKLLYSNMNQSDFPIYREIINNRFSESSE